MDKEDYETLAAFRYRLRQFLRFSEDTARDHGLTPQQHQLLLAIKGYPARDEATIGELAERLQLRHHSVVGVVDRSEHAGLVERVPHPSDRRAILVRLTSEGEAMLESLTVVHRQELVALTGIWEQVARRLTAEE